MYTRCPECATVFRVTAEQLRMAHGDVRCGNCSKSFNALLSLMDERPAQEDNAGAVPQEASSVESEEDLEFNAPEQSWTSFFITAEAAPAIAPAEHTPREAADEPVAEFQREPLDEPDDEPLDEHTGEREEWRGMLSDLADDAGDTDDGSVYSVGPDADYEDDEPTSEHPIITAPEAADKVTEESESDAGPEEEEIGSEIVWVLEDVDEGHTPSDDYKDGDLTEVEQPAPITQFAYSDYVENVVLESAEETASEDPDEALPPWINEERLDEAFPASETSTSPRWYAAGAVLLIMLVAQLIHYNRDSLAAHPSVGGAIRATYSAFNVQLFPEWGLDSFKVTGSDAVAGRSAPVALDVLAEVAVKSAEPVGLPLVRVVLRDRWSNPVANRVFRPIEYAPGAIDTTAVATPGTTIPVEISVADPGTDALSYVVDICLPHRTEGLQCQLARDPFRR